MHVSLYVTTLNIFFISGEYMAYFHRWLIFAKYCNAIPAFLAMPDWVIAKFANGRLREFLLWRLQLLQASHVGCCRIQPAQQHWQAAIDAVDIEGCDSHGFLLYAI